jgi:hypothetical protein
MPGLLHPMPMRGSLVIRPAEKLAPLSSLSGCELRPGSQDRLSIEVQCMRLSPLLDVLRQDGAPNHFTLKDGGAVCSLCGTKNPLGNLLEM